MPKEDDSGTGMDKDCAFLEDSQHGNLQNTWLENSRIACENCAELLPPKQFNRNILVLKSDGRFSYTYALFTEDYVDYAGSYEWDSSAGTIAFKVDGGEPPGFDGEGAYSFMEDGRLILRDIWLSDEIESCGYELMPLAG